MRKSIVIRDPQRGHAAYVALWQEIKAMAMAGHVMVVSVKPETRSLQQNALLWALLTDVSRQVVWHGKKLSPEDWKHMFSSSLKSLRVVPNLDGTGFVALGLSTSQMSKAEMSDMCELIQAFGAANGVKFSAPDA